MYFEKYVVQFYHDLVCFIKQNIEKSATLEDDLATLARSDISFERRMVVLYRSEKKKIIRN